MKIDLRSPIGRLLFIVTLSFFPFAAWGLQEIRHRDTGQQDEYWSLHQQGARFYVEKFIRPRGQLQTRTRSWSFANESPARRLWMKVSRGFHAYVHAEISTTEVAPENLRSESTAQVIWPTTQSWSEAWEAAYTKWIADTASATYLSDHGVATDCADVAYAYRWIFARLNGLPMANRLAASGDLFTNESMRAAWLNLPTDSDWSQDARFMAALNYLLENTYTHLLMGEAYPVAMTLEQLNAGAFFLDLHSAASGHTQLIRTLVQDLSEPAPLRMLASDVPRQLRVLYDYGFESYESPPELGKRAFLRFRWAQKNKNGTWKVIAASQMPGYSTAQFDPHFMEGYNNVREAVVSRVLPGWKPDLARAMNAQLQSAVDRILRRKRIVEDGFQFCQAHDCAPGTSNWETWSTPSRDQDIAGLSASVRDLLSDPECTDACQAAYTARKDEVLLTVDGRDITIDLALQRLFWLGLYSPDPRVSIARRWGVDQLN